MLSALADFADAAEKILSQQVGLGLGLILGGGLSWAGMRIYMLPFTRKIEAFTEAVDIQNRLIAGMLVQSELQSISQLGTDALQRMNRKK